LNYVESIVISASATAFIVWLKPTAEVILFFLLHYGLRQVKDSQFTLFLAMQEHALIFEYIQACVGERIEIFQGAVGFFCNLARVLAHFGMRRT
jgi:hypothetical protein